MRRLILKKLLSVIIKSNETESSNYLADEVNTTLIDKFNLSNIEFEELNSDDLIQILIDNKKISSLHLEDLANIFYNLAKTSIVQNAWRNGQDLMLHGWVYGLNSGFVTDLNVNISSNDELDEVYQLTNL